MTLDERCSRSDSGACAKATHEPTAAQCRRSWAARGAYVGMLLVGGLALGMVRAFGAECRAPAASDGVARASHTTLAEPHVLAHVLVILLGVLLISRAVVPLFRRLRQPAVIGEIAAGLLIGPSCFGRLAPELSARLLPSSALPTLGAIAQLGVILYMFLVGLELDLAPLRKSLNATFAIAHASIVLPLVLGAVFGLYLYPRLSSSDVPFMAFASFVGVSMSVTAFPVLARILSELGLTETPLGSRALACAAAGDVSAWCLLALIVGIARSQSGAALLTLISAALYSLGMLLVVKPLVTRWLHARREAGVTRADLTWVLIGLLSSALVTEYIGLHAIFGAFAFGSIIAHDSALARRLPALLEELVLVLLLPAFFAVAGMRTQLGLVATWGDLATCAAVVVVASVGKFGGTYLASRVAGYPGTESAVLAALMNTRGLMELIVLNVGLDLGVISSKAYSMLVVMALVTTLATTPAVRAMLFRPGQARSTQTADWALEPRPERL